MDYSRVTRVVAACVLLIHGSAFGAATVFDAIAAGRANGAAHIEADAGAGCYAHDEASCRLCRMGATSGCTTAAHVMLVVGLLDEPPVATAYEHPPSVARTALHSRAPPIA